MPVDLETERAALDAARQAVVAKIEKLSGIKGGGVDSLADEYIDAVVRGAIDKLRHELVTFGRIDDDQPWRIGLYGIDDGAGDQLVVDWRAPFAEAFYQAAFDDPQGLARRVSYVGCIDDLFVEEFATGEVVGSSPLMAELSKSRGEVMKAAVATLQVEQDRIVRLDPKTRVVVRGGPGTGKTVVGLHRAAWLVYNDTRVFADRILVLGPSDRFLRYIATVLPTLGETRMTQTTFARLLGDDSAPGDGDPANDPRWIELVDRFEASLLRPSDVAIGLRTIPEAEIADMLDRYCRGRLPWKDRRRQFVDALMARTGRARAQVTDAIKTVFPSVTTRQAWRSLRNRAVLERLGAPADLVDQWLAAPGEPAGALHDEVRSRIEGVPARYSHVIVDEAQDLSLLQLRAVLRRADGCTLVGDDAQRSAVHGIGLRPATELLDAELVEMNRAYRMSAEIAYWLNDHAERHRIDAIRLDGLRPTGVAVRTVSANADADALVADLRSRWPNVTAIAAGETWGHKGVEYDGVVVLSTGMSPTRSTWRPAALPTSW